MTKKRAEISPNWKSKANKIVFVYFMLRLLHCHSFRKQISFLNPEHSTIFSNILCTAIVYGYFERLKMRCHKIGHNNRIVFVCILRVSKFIFSSTSTWHIDHMTHSVSDHLITTFFQLSAGEAMEHKSIWMFIVYSL